MVFVGDKQQQYLLRQSKRMNVSEGLGKKNKRVEPFVIQHYHERENRQMFEYMIMELECVFEEVTILTTLLFLVVARF